MPKCNNQPQSIKNDAGAEHAIIIELSQKLDCGYSFLIGAVDILLETPPYVFQDLVDDGDGEGWTITLQVISQHR